MIVTTTKTTAESGYGVEVPAGKTGEVIGDGYTDERGIEWLAVDFGEVVGDFKVTDLEVVAPA